MRIIGLGHKARQGKDLVAQLLVKEAGRKDIYAKQYGFADMVRAACRLNFQMGDKEPALLQLVGTELYRNFVHEDYWIHQLELRIFEEQPDLAVITDVRFPNEYDFVQANGGCCVRIDRYIHAGGIKLPYRSSDRNPNHASEISLDEHQWDEILDNDGSVEDLRAKVITLL